MLVLKKNTKDIKALGVWDVDKIWDEMGLFYSFADAHIIKDSSIAEGMASYALLLRDNDAHETIVGKLRLVDKGNGVFWAEYSTFMKSKDYREALKIWREAGE